MDQLDAIDLEILRLLQEDGRRSNAELARQVGLTPTPTLERVKRLERDGVIRRYSAHIDPAALGKGLMVFASVSLAMHDAENVEQFEAAVKRVPAVLECHHVTGEADFLLKIVVADTREYERLLLQHLTKLPGVRQIRSSVVLSTLKEETCIPIPTAGDG
jgi:Lrp/AsnC family transcriptional regulator, leucine-responsive regulatory protein